jgi:hypothetical protein
MIFSVILGLAFTLQGVTSNSLRTEPITIANPRPQHVFEIKQHKSVVPAMNAHRRLGDRSHLVPTYPGYGSHFAYLYIGEPPQRQAVILDTASAWTAFPCTGCKDCGEHVDDYFVPKKSKTFSELTCNQSQKCLIQNAYSTSQWGAYGVRDRAFLAGNDIDDVTNAKDYTFNLTFGCMTETNEDMKEQAADGVLGLAITANTLAFQYAKEARVEEIFSLCLRLGGGILTLGGVNSEVQYPGHTISWTTLSNKSNPLGFWRVKVEKMAFETHGEDKKFINIGTEKDMVAFDIGKGTIIDSATSQSYFPKSFLAALGKAFEEATGGVKLKTTKLTEEQVKLIPTLLVFFKDAKTQKSFAIKMPATDYLETNGDGEYNIMLRATETKGAVLGANFLDG